MMEPYWNGFNFAVCLTIILVGSNLVNGTYDRPYLGSPVAPRNLLRPSPGKVKFSAKSLPSELPKAPETEWRLPTALKPVHYVIRLQPFIGGNYTILGHVDIEMEVLEPTSNVTVHMKALNTSDETIKVEEVGGGAGVGIVNSTYDAYHEFFIVSLAEELQVGQNYIFSMDFEGLLDNNGYGFYRASYEDENGNTVYLALSMFAPEGARRAFPCFDEPSLKASFDVTLGREDTMNAISNAPLIDNTPIEGQPGWSWDTFETTVVMSTYLLVFVVSDFASNTTTTSSGIPFGVWSRQQKINTTKYALEKGPDVLDFFGTYFEIPYTMPKMDMLSSSDFGGAMENWGGIVFSESLMLYDPEVDSFVDKQYVMLVIAHENAHQWFGNLVTTAWWSHIWLNEGFAQYLEYIGADFCEPTWNIKDLLLTDDLQYVFELDSLEEYSHPIIRAVETPAEVHTIFDSITYDKGASVNRMQNNILTEATFVQGLINYLNMYQYTSAYQDYLFEHLTNSGHTDGTLPIEMTMKEIMDTWTLQGGYPLITVNRSSEGITAAVSQKRFWTDHVDTNETWWVPITYTTQDNPNFDNTQPMMWMSDIDREITIDSLPSQDQWVIFNIQETGYYRVNYDDNNWNLLFQQLATNPDVIHPLNRAQINDDYLDIARAGIVSYESALEMLTYLPNEMEFTPWAAALNNIDYLHSMLFRTEGQELFKDYLLQLILPLYEKMGFQATDNIPPQEQLKQMLALAWTCVLGYEECEMNSVDLYHLWMKNPSNQHIIHPNMKKTVYCTAIAKGGIAEWDFAWSQYLKAETDSEKYRLLEAMGCSKDSEILLRYLDMAYTSGSGIRKDDAMIVFSAVAKNNVGRDVAWSFLRQYGHFIAKHMQTHTCIGDMVKMVTETFNTDEDKTQLEDFHISYSQEMSPTYLEESVSTTNRNIKWMKKNYETIMQWLENRLSVNS